MDTKETLKMMQAVCEATIGAKEELCKLDSYVGDGDHGFTVERGFKAVKEELESGDYKSPVAVLEATGDALADTMGGAIGLIIGGLFTGGAEAIGDAAEIGIDEMGTFFQGGLEEIKMIGGAQEGDRTLIDALSPASQAYQKAAAEGLNLCGCLEKAADAAEAGSKATANMVAKKGRAKFLQEESRGYVDAGSVTMSIIIRAMSDYVKSIGV